jgi:hypothetical protein
MRENRSKHAMMMAMPHMPATIANKKRDGLIVTDVAMDMG